MKKIIYLSLVLTLLSSAAGAQRIVGSRVRTQGFYTEKITRPERFQLRRDVLRSNIIQRNASRDGVITPLEKRRIRKAKCNTRRNAFRFRHNGRR